MSFLGGAEVAASSKGAGTAKIVFGQPLKVGGGLTATLTDSTYGTSPFQCLPGGVVLPSNLFKILTAGGDSKGDVVLVLHAPDQGTFRAKAKFGSHAFGAATRTAPGAGNVKLKIHPGSAAQQALKGGTKLTVSVTVSFTPTGGVKRTKKTTVHVSRKAF